MSSLTSVIITVLVEQYKLTGSLGWALVLFTLITRALLLPLTLPSLKAQKKMQALQPELSKLKQKHGANKQALQAAQLELYKKHNLNPLAGCLPQVVQIGLLIVLYRALVFFLKTPSINGVEINPMFFWLNLSKPDTFFVIPILAAVSQFVLSLMILPATETPDLISNTSKKKAIQKANKKEEDTAEMAATMQQQMAFVMPVMIRISALTFPSGLGLYWVVTTLFSIVQQWAISGPGGLLTYPRRARVWLDAHLLNR